MKEKMVISEKGRLLKLWFVMILLLAGFAVRASEVVFEEDFNGFADGEHPSSLLEIKGTPWLRGEVVNKRYAINAGGNAHRLIMPKVKNFELSFTAEPHKKARYAPIMIINFRQNAYSGNFGRLPDSTQS